MKIKVTENSLKKITPTTKRTLNNQKVESIKIQKKKKIESVLPSPVRFIRFLPSFNPFEKKNAYVENLEILHFGILIVFCTSVLC